MHKIADALMVAFEGGDATNYIEQTFEDKEDSSRCFVLTMQMKEGLTPCQKLSTAEERVKQLEDALKDLVKISLEMVEKIENEWGTGRDIEDLRGKNLIDKEIITAELLLNKEQP